MKAIYKITNKINGKIYIGQSNNPKQRWKSHKMRAKNIVRERKNSAIHYAIAKYGESNFVFEVIGWFEDYNEKEIFFIKKYNSLVPNGYNIQIGGNEPPHKYGEEHHNSIYKQKIIDDVISDLLSGNLTQSQIQKKHSVSQQLVTSINTGRTHKREGLQYPLLKDSVYNCSNGQVENIKWLLKNSICTSKEIGDYFNFSTSTVKAINSGKNHFDANIKYPIRNFRGKANTQSVEAILAKRSTGAIDTHSGNVGI